jgi:hypothetical protein
MSLLHKTAKTTGDKRKDAQKKEWEVLTSVAASSMAIECSCVIQFLAGTVLEIFAKSEGWYEYSPYEYKVSVIEGEAITSMGIETGLKMSIRGHEESQVGKNRRVKDNESDATWAIKRWLNERVNNQFAGIAMLRMLGVVCEERKLEYMWRID